MIFGSNSEEFLKNRTNILAWLGRGRSKIIKEIDKEKKIQIMKKLCNMNSLIIPDELREVQDYEDEE